jgi:hypothetical protein
MMGEDSIHHMNDAEQRAEVKESKTIGVFLKPLVWVFNFMHKRPSLKAKELKGGNHVISLAANLLF